MGIDNCDLVPYRGGVIRYRDPLDELKCRARIRLNALLRGDVNAIGYAAGWIAKRRRWQVPDAWKLHHALNIVSAEIGFHDWQHARRVLGGRAHASEDMGGLWYDCRCQVQLNYWFARYHEAEAFVRQQQHYWLFPFRKQFVAGDAAYVRRLGLDPDAEPVIDAQRNVHEIYGTPRWRSLCVMRLAATRVASPLLRHF